MSFISEVKARFVETDASGEISHLSYISYLELARIEFLDEIGAGDRIENWSYVVGHVACDIHSPAYFNDKLQIHSDVSKVGNTSFHLNHKIIRTQDKELVASGKAVLIHFNFDTQKSEAITETIKDKLKLYSNVS